MFRTPPAVKRASVRTLEADAGLRAKNRAIDRHVRWIMPAAASHGSR